MRSAILGFIGGAAWLQTQAELPAQPELMLLALLLACLLRRTLLQRAPLALLVGALAGFGWAAVVAGQALAPQLARAEEGRDFDISGTIDSLPFRFEGGVRFNLLVEDTPALPPRIALSWYAGQGARQLPLPILHPGQRWRLRVRLQRPHGNANPYGFDYELWLLEQGVRATGYVRTDGRNERVDDFVPTAHNAVERLRDALGEKIAAALSGKRYAAVIAALVMGDQRGIPQQDWLVFNRTGIAHLVSISGLHITMIAGLAAWLVSSCWRHSFGLRRQQLPLLLPAPKVAALAGMLAALGYVALAGFGVPAQRTLYMLAVVACALWLDRLAAVTHVLALAAAVVVLLDPWAVMWPGFWLSFGAVAVILYASSGRAAAPPDTRRARWLAALAQAGRTQYAVTLGLVPLTMLLFAQVSLASPLANALAIPVVSLLVTPLALAGSVLPQALGAPLLQLAHAALALLVDGLRWLAMQPWATWSAPQPSPWLFAWTMAGTCWALAPRGWPRRWLGLACWIPLLAAQPEPPPPGAVRLTAFDVGQGMAVLVETAGHRLLYDTGPQYAPEINGGNRVILPYLRARGIGRLDVMVVSHSDTDHSGGAREILATLPVGQVLSSLPAGHPLTRERHVHCAAGQNWEWEGVRFEMMHPLPASYQDASLKANARSCTLRISAAGAHALLAGDIEAPQEAELLARGAQQLRADVLLVPHHGSGTSSTAPFLAAVQPHYALFQLGYRNRYHHPRTDVVARYAALGATMARSDQAGAIGVELGEGVALHLYRQEHRRYWYGQ